MFCQNCGTKLNDDAKFCMNCGAKIIVADQVHNSSSTSENLSEKAVEQEIISTEENEVIEQVKHVEAESTIDAKQMVQSEIESKSVELNEKENDIDKLKDVIQKNDSYYLTEFKKIDIGEKTKFNWAAFLLSAYFCLYRKCTNMFKKYFMIPLVITVAASVLTSIGTAQLELTLMSVGGVLSAVGSIWMLVNSYRLGKKFNKDYYEHCKVTLSNGEQKKFGTSLVPPIILTVVIVAVVSLVSYMASSMAVNSILEETYNEEFDSSELLEENIEDSYEDNFEELIEEDIYEELIEEDIYTETPNYYEETEMQYYSDEFVGHWEFADALLLREDGNYEYGFYEVMDVFGGTFHMQINDDGTALWSTGNGDYQGYITNVYDDGAIEVKYTVENGTMLFMGNVEDEEIEFYDIDGNVFILYKVYY